MNIRQSAIARHLEAAQFDRAGIIRRISRESGLFVAVLVTFSLVGLTSDVVLSAHGLSLFLIALLPSLGLIALGLWMDRHEPEPAWLLMRCLIWGGTLSILVATLLNTVLGEFAGEDKAASFVAPLVEETVKAVAILWLLSHHRSHMNGRADAIVYALFVGVGFTIVEDFHYYVRSYGDLDESVLATVLVRVPSTLLHPLFTAIIAVGLVLGFRREGVLRYLLPAVGYTGAVVLHGMWNSEIPTLLRAGLFLPLSLGLVFITIASSRSIEKTRIDALIKSSLLSCPQSRLLREVVDARRPGLLEWLAATRDPAHRYHLNWRIQQLAWISTSPSYAKHLDRASQSSSPSDVMEISAEAKELLRTNLDLLLELNTMSDSTDSTDSRTSTPSHTDSTPAVALWNSNAAIVWSILLTPVFGAYLQLLNWRALGQVERAGHAKSWLVAGLVSIPAGTGLGALDLMRGDGSYFAEIYQLAFFLIWYFAFAKQQSTYQRDTLTGAYERKPWLIPVLIGMLFVIIIWAIQTLALLLLVTGTGNR